MSNIIKKQTLHDLNIIGSKIGAETVIGLMIITNNSLGSVFVALLEDSRGFIKIAKLLLDEKKLEGFNKNECIALLNTLIELNTKIIDKNDLSDILKKVLILQEFRTRILNNNKIGIYIVKDIMVNEKSKYTFEFPKKDIKLIPEETAILIANSYQTTLTRFNEEYLIDKFNEIKSTNYLDDIEVKITLKNLEIYERGTIISTLHQKEHIKFITEPMTMYLLGKVNSKLLSFKNTNIVEMLSVLVQCSGVAKLGTVDNKEIDKIKEKRKYRVVYVINNFKLEESIVFGKVEFSNGIELSDNDKRDLFMNNKNIEYYTYATVYVTSETAADAQKLSYSILQDTLNFIIILYKNSTIFSLYNNTCLVRDWGMDRLFTKVSIAKSVFIQNIPLLESRIVTSFDNEVESNKIFSIDKISVNEDMISDSFVYQSKEKDSIIKSAYWINKSIECIDLDEATIYFNIGLEFVLNGETGDSMLDDCKYSEKEKFIENISKFIDSNYIDESSKDKIKQKIIKSIDSETSLMSKFYNMCERLNIKLNDDEYEVINKLRKDRNSIIHGHKKNREGIEKHEIYRGYVILSKIIFEKYKEKGEINFDR